MGLPEASSTRIGELSFTHDYPTDSAVESLFNEMDFRRVVQAYLWAIPLVSFVNWQLKHASRGLFASSCTFERRSGTPRRRT